MILKGIIMGRKQAGWIVQDGYTDSVKGSAGIITKQSFGSCRLHVEFEAPVDGKGIS
jgi:hypothetical protein